MHIKLIINVLMKCRDKNGNRNGTRNRSPSQVSGNIVRMVMYTRILKETPGKKNDAVSVELNLSQR
jgi:hypothetical protein